MRLRCRATFMDDWLKKTFDRLGRAIGEQPGYFLIVPVLLSALCASGFRRVKFMADPEYLFSPTDGEAKHERAMLEHHFPNNFTAFDPSRFPSQMSQHSKSPVLSINILSNT